VNLNVVQVVLRVLSANVLLLCGFMVFSGAFFLGFSCEFLLLRLVRRLYLQSLLAFRTNHRALRWRYSIFDIHVKQHKILTFFTLRRRYLNFPRPLRRLSC
jgi:hypothetical protein